MLPDQVSRPYRTTGKTTLTQILILRLFTTEGKTNGSGLNGGKLCQKSSEFNLNSMFKPNVWNASVVSATESKQHISIEEDTILNG
jgi:hypothetical protein